MTARATDRNFIAVVASECHKLLSLPKQDQISESEVYRNII